MPAGRPDLQEAHDALSTVINWAAADEGDHAQFLAMCLTRRRIIEGVFATETGQVLVPRVPLEQEVPFP